MKVERLLQQSSCDGTVGCSDAVVWWTFRRGCAVDGRRRAGCWTPRQTALLVAASGSLVYVYTVWCALNLGSGRDIELVAIGWHASVRLTAMQMDSIRMRRVLRRTGCVCKLASVAASGSLWLQRGAGLTSG